MSIDIKDIEVVGLRHAIVSMRNPMNSWDESDSVTDSITGQFTMGKKDHELAMKLVKAGTDHSKFMRDIQIKCQISAPLYWWKEMDTYKVSTVRNSCSTMHKILEKEFTMDDFSMDKMDVNSCAYSTMLEVISELNLLREFCLDHKPEDDVYKVTWYKLIQLLPSSYIQTSSWSGSYQTLRNIYSARKNHKLDEWHKFCDTIEYLPCSEFITCKSAKDELIEKLKKDIEEIKQANKYANEAKDLKVKELVAENEKLKIEVKNLKDLDALNKNVIRIIKEGVEDIVCHRHEEPTNEYTERYVIRLVQETVDRLKYKLKNSDIVDEVLIDKTKELLDENKAAKKRNDGYLSYLMGMQTYCTKKRLNLLYGTACCPIKTVSDDEKCCENCRWGDLQPNPHFYPCTKCEASEPSNWEPKKGGEEV